jgi:cell division protein FtsX
VFCPVVPDDDESGTPSAQLAACLRDLSSCIEDSKRVRDDVGTSKQLTNVSGMIPNVGYGFHFLFLCVCVLSQ